MMNLSPEEMREIFNHTEIIRRPTYGIVSGYHELPYVCLGASFEPGRQTTEVRGKVHVSPRFVIRPSHYEPRYAEIFGEENVDAALAGRIFGFLGFRSRPIECKSEHLELKHLNASLSRVLSDILDDMDRREDITTGVIITPNSHYYPVSIERFISSVLEDEFSA
jgi:hypothetical protein